jgi:alcohol dehydrogenase class IV
MLSHVLRHNVPAAMTSYAELGTLLDPQLAEQGAQAQAQGFVEHMARLCSAAGLAQRLRDVGVGEGDLGLLVAEAMKQERLLVNNPCPITEADARRLYEAAL